MAASEIQLFQALKNKLGEEETEALLSFVKEKINENNKEQHERNLRVLATKEDFFLLKEDIAALRGDVGVLRVEFKGDLGIVKGYLETKIAEFKSDIIRWVFAFFVTLMLAIIGLYFKR